MPLIEITKPAAGDPTTKDLIDDVIDNQIFLNNNIAAAVGGLILNWSFETDADSDGEADGWDYTNYTGGSNALNTAQESGGVTCQSFTSTVLANGGGYADSIDFIEVIGSQVYQFAINRHASVADVSNQMQVTWYDDAQSSISTTTCYQDTNTPTSRSRRGGNVLAPATARYAKVRTEGGVPAVGTATGTVYFDNVYFDINLGVVGLGDFSGDLDITFDLTNHNHHKIWLYDCTSGSDGGSLVADISTDNQSTWKTGASDYEYNRHIIDGAGSGTWSNSAGSASLPLVASQIFTSAQMKTTGFFEVIRPSSSYTVMRWELRYDDASGGPQIISRGWGVYNGSSSAITDLRLDFGQFFEGSWLHEVMD